MSDIYPLLDEAIAFIDQNSISLAKSIRDALLARLELRRLLLVATAFDIASDEQGQASCWKLCLNRLPALKSSRGLGISMESSISTKIQRRLASSVPPRPIVKTEFNDAYEFLERLFQDGIEVEDVLSCPTGSNIFVSA